MDEKQVAALPPNIRHDIIHGSDEAAKAAYDKLMELQRDQGRILIGEAGLELLQDKRTIKQEQKG